MRKLAKTALEEVIFASGIPALLRRFGRKDRVILAYHNVIPRDAPAVGETSLHLPLDDFRAQLDILQEHFHVVPLSDLLESHRKGDRPQASITFDDAYRGCLEFAVEELSERELPATVFVAPGLLEGGGFWWDLLADPRTGRLDPLLRQRVLGDLSGIQNRVLDWAIAEGLDRSEVPALFEAATAAEVMGISQIPGISIGSHTWSHCNLDSISNTEMTNELARPLQWLRQNRISGCSVLSYPYGLPPSGRISALDDAGYAFGLMIQGGGASASEIESSPFHVPRVNIPRGLSPKGFALRISGAWIR